MSAFSTTVFNNAPMLSEINRGVQQLQTKIIYPTGNPLSPAGDTDLANQEYSFEVRPPAGYYLLPGSSQFRCEVLMRNGDSDLGPTDAANTCLIMGAPHALWGRVEHTFGGTSLLNDGMPYQSAIIQHLKSANQLEDNTVHTDGYWVDSRRTRRQHTGTGVFAQRVPLRWQPATPFFETGQALWCGGGSHELKLTGHQLWRSRIMDAGIANANGLANNDVRVGIFDLAFHAVFAKMDPQYGPQIDGKPATILPRHVNYTQDYANTITVSSHVLEAATVDKTFTVQLPGSVTQIYCWLQEDERSGTVAGGTLNKPLHFFDGHAAGSSITGIRVEHDGVQMPSLPYNIALDPAVRMRGEAAYNDLIEALGVRGSGAGTPITPGMWKGNLNKDMNLAGVYTHGATVLGSWNLYGFRVVKPVTATAMTNFTVTVSRAAGAALATKLYVACVQPFEVDVTFDQNLNLAEVTKTIM
jgi:hypothetical protein